MNDALKKPNQVSCERFEKLVPQAVRVAESRYALAGGHVRVRRSAQIANQIQVWRGEPIAVHIPEKDDEPERWVVLDVAWQLRFAKANPKAAQHASHPFDCMQVGLRHMPPATDPESLQGAMVAAVQAAANPISKAVIAAVKNTRDAVANVLIDALSPIVDAVDSPEIDDDPVEDDEFEGE